MRLIYRWVGHFGILMACLAGLTLFASLVKGELSEEMELKSIEAGIFWILAMVAYGNADRCTGISRSAKYYDSFGE